MATYSAKFYTKNTAGTNQAHNIYSTGNEAGGQGGYFAVKVNSSSYGYVALTTNTSVSTITSGRCKSSNGTTWYMCSKGVPNYYSVLITWNGTFTVPTGVTKLRLTLVGGGAGGFVPNRQSNNTNRVYGGVGGGTTTFGTVAAAGGTDSSIAYYASTVSSESGTYTYYYYNASTASQSTGYHNGGYYNDSNSHDGGASVALTNYAGTVIGYAGAGGYADGNGSAGGSFPGASGARVATKVNVTPGQQIAYSIGGAGNGNRMGSGFWGSYNTGGAGGSQGSAGAILLEYGIGIQ